MFSESVLAIGAMSVLSVVIVYFVAARVNLLAPTFLSYALHWTVAVALVTTVGLWSSDAAYYDLVGVELSKGSAISALGAGKEGWPNLLSIIYKAFGHVPTLGLLVNVLAVSLTVPIIGLLARRLGLPERKSAWLMALLPPAALWGSLLLRESLAWFFLALAILGFSGLALRQKVLPDLMLVLTAIVGLLSVRGTAAIIVAAAGFLAVVLVRRLGGGSIILLATATLIASGPLAGRLDSITGAYSVETLNASREALSRTASSAFPVANLSDPLSVLVALPNVGARVLFGPFPWEWTGLAIGFALDGIMWVAILVLAVRGWRRTENRRDLWVVTLPAVALLAVLALTSGNYGTMERLRVQPEILLLPLAAAGLGRRQNDPSFSPDGGGPALQIITKSEPGP